MATNASRGDAVSSFYPGFAGASGVKSYITNLKGQVLSGTLISANIVYPVSHTLGIVPRVIQIQTLLTKAQAASAVVQTVSLANAASAATSSVFYVCGNGKGIKYRAFVQA